MKTQRFDATVIVIGNLSVGGTGKTPLTLYLARCFLQQGDSPIIITRGYKGNGTVWPIKVTANSDSTLVGDEAVLLAQRSGCPVYAGSDRCASIQMALTHAKKSRRAIILCDDGLQHYRLQRDVEIAVIDGVRQFGNGWLLPAGPLREPVSRLKSVDFTVIQGAPLRQQAGFIMHLQGEVCRALNNAAQQCPLSQFKGTTVHAVAGIGRPERFFKSLEKYGIQVIRHPFPDHHAFCSSDIRFNDTLPVVMTEKDAVKCRAFAEARHWYLPVEVNIDGAFFKQLQSCIKPIPS